MLTRCALLAALLSGCPMDEGVCEPVNDLSFSPTPPERVGFVDAPVSLVLSAARIPCLSDAPLVNATVTITGPDDVPHALNPQVTVRSRTGGLVEAVVDVRFPLEGTWAVRASFDPSLGAQTRLVHVAHVAALDAPLAHVELSGACVGAPWPLSAHAIVCEREDEHVEVLDADGGVQTFPGAQLAVVDAEAPVLWSRRADVLERRDEALVVTDQWAGTSSRPLAGLHDVDSAVRFSTDGGFLVVAPFPVDLSSARPALAVDGVRVGVTNGGNGLTWNGCLVPEGCPTSLRGLEGGLRWGSDGGELIAQQLPAFETEPPRARLRLDALIPPSPARPSVDEPVLLDAESARVVVSDSEAGLVFTAWPAARLWRVGRRFVLLTGLDGGVDVFPR